MYLDAQYDGWYYRKKSSSSREFNYVGDPKGPFRDRQLYPSRDDNVPFFSNAFHARPFLQQPFSHNSNYPHRPARARARSFVVVSPTAQRALISGSLVGYPQKTFRKKFLRHFVEPPGQRTRMLSMFFFFVYPFLSLCLRLSRSHPVIAGEQVSFIRGGMRRD